MNRTVNRPSFILSFLLSVVLASAASAGYWEVVYDLAPDSESVTNAPGGPYSDEIAGTLTLHYDAASTGAPLSGARLVSGIIIGTLSQNAGILSITGTNTNTLLPGSGGTPGVLSGNSLQLSVVANHNLSGFLHCHDATGTGGVCDQYFGTPSSNPIPQNMTGPFTIPRFDFSATAGVGDFTSTVLTSNPQGAVTVMVTYKGKEISRTFMPEPGGVAMLIPGLLLLTGLTTAHRRRAR